MTASGDYENPLAQVNLAVEFVSPSGKRHAAAGFWDGGRTWRVRFCPGETGQWTWQSRCKEDKGLGGRTGEFTCAALRRDNPLFMHGAVRVSENRWYLAHADGTPWFWLSDTAWNGALLSTEAEWEKYLADRAAKGFTAVQFVTTQWRTAPTDEAGQAAYTGKEPIAVNPAFYQRMDKRFDALNERGLVAAPVLAWAVGNELDPGTSLPEDQLLALVRYQVARYGAHHVVWILGGDGNYRGERAEKWKRIGRAVFGGRPSQAVTMHMNGQGWYVSEFREEPWFGFVGYQSGHGDSDKSLEWLVRGPPAADWKTEPHHPVINLEPNYEGHRAYQSKQPITAFMVRRAAWWSLLVSPTAGVTYGCHGVWSWQKEAGVPRAHPNTGAAPAWHEAIALPGSTDMKRLKDFFASVQWQRLRPAQDRVVKQPGGADPKKFVAAARADDGSFAVAYLPAGGTVELRTDGLKGAAAARWYDPREGKWSEAGAVALPAAKFSAPSGDDWVLW
ncbi:MAG: DUF4038 domain-containing protein, partial [Acidobacteria bacterium]|nr:DUF4038 domain-containing protein [Acidobacteriota bacterium]